MCVLLKWLAVDPLSIEHREGPQTLDHQTQRADNGIMGREKWKNNEIKKFCGCQGERQRVCDVKTPRCQM